MLQDFPYQRILNLSDCLSLEKSFLSHSIDQLASISNLLCDPDKDTVFFDHLNLNKQSTEEIQLDSQKPLQPLKEKKKRIRKYTSNNPNNKKGYWTVQENLKYHYFLESNAQYFIDSQRRKIDKIFKSMSAFIETRQPHQCRSHHQKIQQKWETFPKILLNLRLQNFRQTKKKYLVKEFLKMGLANVQFLEDDELKNENDLYKKVVKENDWLKECEGEKEGPQNYLIVQNFVKCHKANCMCLMMSENYEDQLNF